MRQSHLYTLVLIALMTAVICVLAPVSLPLGPVPVSLATFAILLTAYILGWKRGTTSILIYILLGLTGLPVFSAYGAGFSKIVGPTGGYIIGYLPLAAVTGRFADRYSDRIRPALGMVLGTLVLYIFGTAWLAHQMQMTIGEAIMAGVIPFLPGDIGKIIITAVLGPLLRSTLQKTGLLRP